MNEISLPLETLATLTALEGRPLARDASPETLRADIGSRYDFLDRPLSVQLEDARVLIRWAEESEEDQAQAARLLERAGRRAREGEHERVAALCRQALRFQPSLHAARRELACACVEAGERANGLATLWQAVRANPGDTGVILALGRLRLGDGERETAERLARLALESEASNPEALDLLGHALVEAGREEEALSAFGRALLLDPQLPGPRLGAARALLRRGQAEESQARLEELLKQAGQMEHPASVLTPARELYVEIQEHLTRRDLGLMRQAVEDFRRKLEEQHGVPIRVVNFEEKDHAWVQVAWTHGRDHHLVGGPPSLPEPVRLHLLAQQLLRVQLESRTPDIMVNQNVPFLPELPSRIA